MSMRPGPPWLSVVMPTYNGAAYLEAALESVARQDDVGLEVIAVDDGSTDATLELLARYEGRLPLSIVRREHRGSWTAHTNLGLTQAQGRYACILHQDDYWLPGRLRTLKPLVDSHPEVVLFLHPAQYVDDAGRTLGPWRCPLPKHGRPLSSREVLERLLVQNFIAMPSPLFRRDRALSLGGLKEPLWYTADWDLWLRLAAAGPTLYHPHPLACFRVHGQSQTVQSSLENDSFRLQLEEVLGDHLLRYQEQYGPLPAPVVRAARFSVEVNTALAGLLHGQRRGLRRVLWQSLGLGPRAWHRYLRDSRLPERLLARLRLPRGSSPKTTGDPPVRTA